MLTSHPRNRRTALRHGDPDSPRRLAALTFCILLTVALLACASDDRDSTPRSLADENAALKAEIATLRQTLDERDARIQELEQAAAAFPDKERWSKDKNEWWSQADGDPVERTARLAEDAGGEVHYVEHPGRGDRTVLVIPRELTEGETPLIVSLHGFGGDSALQSAYVPLHKRVSADGFALLLPNGMLSADGSRSWNPTDDLFTKNSGTTSQDDVAYLTELVAEARKVANFGPVYFFGYSNGGFMAYHIACKGLPDLRAVASLSGTSYVEDSSCDGALPVSVLHIHGAEDDVILYEGDRSEPDPGKGGETAFYAGAEDMLARWSRRAGCDWTQDPQPYAN
jgi:polyhydroxybutyrate depolymerase